MNIKLPLITLFALMFWVANTTAAEEETKPESRWLRWEKANVKFGGFVTAFDSDLSFGIDGVAGVQVNAEDLLGLESTLRVLRLEATYRPGKTRRNQFDISLASYHRSGHGTLTEDITWDDEVLIKGTKYDSVFNFDIIRGTYSYALLQDERMRIALGLGVYVVPIRYGLDITTVGDTRSLDSRTFTVPLPALALRGDFQLVPRLFLVSEINAMYLKLGDFEGSLLDVSVGLEYRPWRYLAFGLAYSSMAVGIEAKAKNSDYPGADFVGRVDVDYNGLMLYSKLTF